MERNKKGNRDDKKGVNVCLKPEKLKGKPGECTPEQIKECHGDKRRHPCE